MLSRCVKFQQGLEKVFKQSLMTIVSLHNFHNLDYSRRLGRFEIYKLIKAIDLPYWLQVVIAYAKTEDGIFKYYLLKRKFQNFNI